MKTADQLAFALSDDQLADLIHELSDILHARLQEKPSDDSWLKRQINNARIEVRSWPTWRQNLIRLTESN